MFGECKYKIMIRRFLIFVTIATKKVYRDEEHASEDRSIENLMYY
jgi:hypothetical protein